MFSRLSPNERAWVLAIAVAGFVMRVALAFRPEIMIATRPYTEDSYYIFTSAWHLALGHGFSVDGIHPTNGVQPLITILYTPFFYLIHDRWLALRWTFVLNGLIVAADTVMIAFIVASLRRSSAAPRISESAPVIAAAIWALSMSFLLQNTNGLERGLTLVLLMASLLVHRSLRSKPSSSRSMWFGILLGLLVLSRVDSVLIVLVFAVYDLIRGSGRRVGFVFVYGTAAFLVSAPWWIYNVVVFHNLMPISGQMESHTRPIADNVLYLIGALVDQLSVVYYHYATGWNAIVTTGVLIALLGCWAGGFLRKSVRRRLQDAYDLTSLVPLAWFCGIIVTYYTFFFGAPHMLERYMAPVRLLLTILFALGVSLFVRSINTYSSQGRRIAAKVSIVALLLGALAYTGGHYFGLLTHIPWWDEFYRTGKWAASQTGYVGMSQTGLTGFIAPNVVNLDGKVNAEVLKARFEDRLGEYVKREDIRYLADWPLEVNPIVEEARRKGVQFNRIGNIDRIIIYERAP